MFGRAAESNGAHPLGERSRNRGGVPSDEITTLQGLLDADRFFRRRLAVGMEYNNMLTEKDKSLDLWAVPSQFKRDREFRHWQNHHKEDEHVFKIEGEGFPLYQRFNYDWTTRNIHTGPRSMYDYRPALEEPEPKEFVRLYPNLGAYEQLFDPKMAIMLPDPLLGTQPQFSWNVYGNMLTSSMHSERGIPATEQQKAIRASLAAPDSQLLGDAWDSLISGKISIGPRHGEPMDDEEMQAAFDRVVAEKFPLQVYVDGLVNMTPDEWNVGSVDMKKCDFSDRYPEKYQESVEPTHAELRYIELISYAGALILAARDVLLVLLALRGHRIALHRLANRGLTPHTKERGHHDARMMGNKTVRKIEEYEDYVEGFPEMGRGYMQAPMGARLIQGSFEESVLGILHPILRFTRSYVEPTYGEALDPESSNDVSPTLDAINTNGAYSQVHASLILTGREHLIARVETLYSVIEERLNRNLPTQFSVSMRGDDGKKVKYVSVAEVSVWPTRMNKDEEKVYLFNPLPPIVENIYIPKIYNIQDV